MTELLRSKVAGDLKRLETPTPVTAPAQYTLYAAQNAVMRGLDQDRIPCVQVSIRSLGLNFTDRFAPFFSVRIPTLKVASTQPLYGQV